MVRRTIKTAGEWVEDRLRQMCGRITPDKRIVVIVTTFLLFTGLSLYVTVSSIYRIGRGESAGMQLQHIERLELELRQKQSQLDSVKQLNHFYYEYERKSE